MNKKILGAALLTALPIGAASAATGYLQGGGANAASLTTRSAGLSSTTGNPAAGQLLLKEGQNFRFGILSTPHIGLEFGPVDNFIDDFEQFEEDFEELEQRVENDTATKQEVLDFIDRSETLLGEFAEAAYVNVDIQQQIPLTPMVFRGFGGVFTVDLAADVKIQMQTIGSNLTLLDQDGNEIVDDSDPNQVPEDLRTNTAAYLKSGVFAELGVGYSRALPIASLLPMLPLPEGMQFSAGVRGKVVQGQLSRQIILLNGEEDSNGETAADRAEENYDANQVTSTAFGLDAGVMFDWKGLYGGMTVYNLIAPSFDFGELGGDCAARFSEPGEAGQRADCEEAKREFVDTGEVPQNETYSDDTRLNVELGYRILESNWVIGGAMDLNKVESVVGHEYQWVGLNAGYESESWWLPGFTLGFRQNLAGTEQSYATASLGLLRVMRINLSYGLEQAEQDGDKIPRSVAFGIGFEMPI